MKAPAPSMTIRNIFVVLVVGQLLSVGCSRSGELNTEYGQRDSGWKSASINGTSLLAELYESAGASVSSWGRLSRRLSRSDTIVWFPTEFQAPTAAQLNYLEEWLSSGPDRTLVFVGPGYTATADYWEAVRKAGTAVDGLELHRRLADARLEQRTNDWKSGSKSSVIWFEMSGLGKDVRRGKLSGPWAESLPSTTVELPRSTRITWPVDDEESAGASTEATAESAAAPKTAEQPIEAEIDPANTEPPTGESTDDEEIELFDPEGEPMASDVIEAIEAAVDAVAQDGLTVTDAVEPIQEADPHEVLLSIDGEPFAWRYRARHWPGSQLIVVTNAAPLLNYALTRPENQQIARRLVADSLSGEKVIFLETGEGGPPIVESQDLPLSGLAALADWPLGPILVQWLVVGMLFCLTVYPIFGRPRNPDEAQPSDFGAHIAALAELLSRTKSVDFARQRVQQFRQQIGREEPKQQPGNPFKVSNSDAKSN